MALTDRLLTLLAVGALAAGAGACGTDDAVERDAKDAAEEVDKKAGNADEEATKEAEKAAEDVDGN